MSSKCSSKDVIKGIDGLRKCSHALGFNVDDARKFDVKFECYLREEHGVTNKSWCKLGQNDIQNISTGYVDRHAVLHWPSDNKLKNKLKYPQDETKIRELVLTYLVLKTKNVKAKNRNITQHRRGKSDNAGVLGEPDSDVDPHAEEREENQSQKSGEALTELSSRRTATPRYREFDSQEIRLCSPPQNLSAYFDEAFVQSSPVARDSHQRDTVEREGGNGKQESTTKQWTASNLLEGSGEGSGLAPFPSASPFPRAASQFIAINAPDPTSHNPLAYHLPSNVEQPLATVVPTLPEVFQEDTALEKTNAEIKDQVACHSSNRSQFYGWSPGPSNADRYPHLTVPEKGPTTMVTDTRVSLEEHDHDMVCAKSEVSFNSGNNAQNRSVNLRGIPMAQLHAFIFTLQGYRVTTALSLCNAIEPFKMQLRKVHTILKPLIETLGLCKGHEVKLRAAITEWLPKVFDEWREMEQAETNTATTPEVARASGILQEIYEQFHTWVGQM